MTVRAEPYKIKCIKRFLLDISASHLIFDELH